MPIFLLALFVVIFFGLDLFFPRLFSTIFTSISRPFWRIEFAREIGLFRDVDTLAMEKGDLQLRLDDILYRSERLNQIESENVLLKSILKRSVSTSSPSFSNNLISIDSEATTSDIYSYKSRYVLGAVLMRPPISFYDELIIDLGLKDGISINDLVYAPGNILIGKVVEELDETSKVLLITSPDQKYEAIVGQEKAIISLYGVGGSGMVAEVPQGLSVEVGDIVSIPSIDNKVVGFIKSKEEDPALPFKKLFISSGANIYNLAFVLVDRKIDHVKSSKK
jgi:cell shape-determining protein MreC